MSFSLPRHGHHASTASINSSYYPNMVVNPPSSHSTQPSINGLGGHLHLPPASVSAAITRILSLEGFPASLKTRDLQAAIAQLLPSTTKDTSSTTDASTSGPHFQFRIKWLTDTSALVVFADPQLAKRAYLAAQFRPPKELSSGQASRCKIRPYDKPDAAQIAAAVQQQANGTGTNAGSGSQPAGVAVPRHGARASFGGQQQQRPASMYASSGGGGSGLRDGGGAGGGLAALGFGLGGGGGGAGAGSALSSSFGNSGSSAAPTAGIKHVRSSSVSTLAGPGSGSQRGPGGGVATGTGTGRPSFGSLLASGGGPLHRRDLSSSFSGAGTGTGGGGGGGGEHHRAASTSSSSGATSWGRNSNVGAFGSFGGGAGKESSAATSGGHDRMGTFRFGASAGSVRGAGGQSGTASTGGGSGGVTTNSGIAGSRLSTHIEVDTPQATPVGPSVSAFPASANNAFGSSLPAAAAEDVSTPALDITGGQIYAEGGPGSAKKPAQGRASPQVSEGARRMVRAGITGSGASASSTAAAAGGVTHTSNGNTLHSGIRRESMDAASAQRALEQVSKALQKLGVEASPAGQP